MSSQVMPTTSQYRRALVRLLTQTNPLLRSYPPGRVRWLMDSGRTMGTLILAPRGSGKSRMLGRDLAYHDFMDGRTLAILDPRGQTIDNLLDRLTRLPASLRKAAWPRIRYVNMAGEKIGNERFVTPWPIYARFSADESLDEISSRFVSVLLQANPALASAQVQGEPRVAPLARALGIILSALGLSITEAYDVLLNLRQWEPRLRALAADRADAAGAVEYVLSLLPLSPDKRDERTEQLRARLVPFRLSETLAAMFGSITGGIDWSEVMRKRQAVLIDFRGIADPSTKQFGLLWVFSSLMTFITRRGPGRHDPLSFIIDEISYLLGTTSENDTGVSDVLAQKLDELINQIMRSHAIWLTIAGQEQYQIPASIRRSFLSMGNVILGNTSEPEAAWRLAERYSAYDPYAVKKFRAVHGSQFTGEFTPFGSPITLPGIVSIESEEFSREEQLALASQRFRKLKRYHFLVGASRQEGVLPTKLAPLSIARLDQGTFVTDAIVAEVRSRLSRRDGIKQADVLAAIAKRQAKLLTEQTGNEEITPLPLQPTQIKPGISRRRQQQAAS